MNYSIPYLSSVTVQVYDISGKLVKTLMNNKNHSAGLHSITLETDYMASGIYFVHLDSGSNQIIHKVTVVK